MAGGGGARVDPKRLANRLKVLSAWNRIELLTQLQMPRTLPEIALGPSRASQTLGAERRLAKQTIAHHLEVLTEHGFIRRHRAVRDGEEVQEYQVDHTELFLLVEELKSLGLIRAVRGHAQEHTAVEQTPTGDGDDALLVHLPKGPALVLVTGPLIGTPHPLHGAGPWVIGRAKSCAVPVAFDPFVSAENAIIKRQGADIMVTGLSKARNGTFLNWDPVPPGTTRSLVPGDVIGVGRSLLLYREGRGK